MTAEWTPPRAAVSSDRRKLRWTIILLAVAMIWLLAAVTPSPYAIERPGPVVDALGDIKIEGELTPVINIDGTTTYPTNGSLNVLSVSLYGTPQSHMTWLDVGLALFDQSARIVPISEVFPSGLTAEERAQSGAVMMSQSQYSAVAAALYALNIEVDQQLTVSSVTTDGPSEDILRVSDILRVVNGVQIHSMENLRAALKETLDSVDPVTLEVERNGAMLELQVSPAPLEVGGDPLLGITIMLAFEFPFDVELNLGDIGGPSAGMIFALAVYDSLTPGGMTGDLDISGTGTITADGQIGPIGGLEQKMWGASRAGTDLFLMPIANCSDLPGAIPGNMRVAPVKTLNEAIHAIETVAAGEDPPGLERCSNAIHAGSPG